MIKKTKSNNLPPTLMVIFGATGDLTSRKLLPALYNLSHDGFLPKNFTVIGASRTKLSDEDFRDNIYQAAKKYSRNPIEDKAWKDFSQSIHYQPLDGLEPSDFLDLGLRIKEIEKKVGKKCTVMYYLATAPRFFAPIAKNLSLANLIECDEACDCKSMLIVEKPFGVDKASATKLNTELRKYFKEDQIYRIDHYLGKETVQNILVFRFANGLFEPVWNRSFIDHIQISVCESISVGSRAGYFDKTGIVRDIVQNHLLQMLSLLCIEPPQSLTDAKSIRNEKVKVLQSVKRFDSEAIKKHAMRAQYTKGRVDGEERVSYKDLDGIAEDSTTETLACLRLEIDNWRWAGVPIYVRAGKSLPKRATQILVYFKKPPGAIFGGTDSSEIGQNVLAIQVQPDEGISLSINSKPPGPELGIKPVEMDFDYDESFNVSLPDAYERLLLDAMKGDATLFTRDDEIEQAWEILDPILREWENSNKSPLYKYEAGTWGPKEMDDFIGQTGHKWELL